MLFLCDLPVDTEPTSDEDVLRLSNKKKLAVVIIIIAVLIIAIIMCIGFILKLKTPKNVSPYCMLMRNENKICKIHDKKHNNKGLAELIIPEEEMAFHKQLFEEISEGAYFDGKQIYKKDDAKEILAIKDNLNKEKESLFDRYLSSSLKDEEKERYNFIIEELDTIEQSIIKLNIKETDKEIPTKEELIEEVASLKRELEQLTSEGLVQMPSVIKTKQNDTTAQIQKEIQTAVKNESVETIAYTRENNVQEDKLIYISQSHTEIQIPKDIENAATIKRSSLYKDR
ncbi:hypothetical protein [Cellulosilyticum sp. I15G10I2]|uniref:hypothetical protein n=1 Tax=Cellulosilyticum sp. I15G10I2 TaxID=1892843 RepID=UPI00085BE34D|nr:hypothetical protein [Cellulosilyticum sp. I15G10I2]